MAGPIPSGPANKPCAESVTYTIEPLTSPLPARAETHPATLFRRTHVQANGDGAQIEDTEAAYADWSPSEGTFKTSSRGALPSN